MLFARGARGGARISSPDYEMMERAAGIILQSQKVAIGDLYEMRTLIEPPAARLVAERKGVLDPRMVELRWLLTSRMSPPLGACGLTYSKWLKPAGYFAGSP